MLYCAEHEIPLVYTPYAAMGGTAPMSQAAIIAQLCAESLSGLVVHQLEQRGAPFIFGGMPSVMDMKTTIFSYGRQSSNWATRSVPLPDDVAESIEGIVARAKAALFPLS